MSSTSSLTSYLSTLPEYIASNSATPTSTPSKSGGSRRLQSLYSDFSRQKLSNPTTYNSNVQWWGNTLNSIAKNGIQPERDCLTIHVNQQLAQNMRWEGVGRPLALGVVVFELQQSGKLIPLKEFMNATQSIYHTPSLAYRVASYVVGKPLWWAMEQLSIVGGEEATIKNDSSLWKKVSGPYVSLDNLEVAADAVLEHWRNNRSSSLSDSLHNQETFTNLYSNVALPDVSLTSSDIKVLIKYLERDRQAIVTEKEVIKLVDDESESIVTAVDHGVLEMKVAISNLQAQIDDIHSRIAQRTSQITENLRAKRKEIALSFLRSRKQLEELLLKRLGALENIQSTLDRIEQAAGDIEIMKVYSTSSETLKALLSHPSLQLPHIESTLSSLAETNAQQQEINEAIQIGGQVAMDASGLDIDEDELQGELESLVQEQREEEEKEKALKALEERVTTQGRVSTIPAANVPNQEATVGDRDRIEHDEEWERRWEAAQRDKEVQKARDDDEETRRRARWAEEDREKLAAED